MWDRFGAKWRRDWRLLATPSVVFAGLVFVGGMIPVSPFATWPMWVLYVLMAPAVAGWVWVLYRAVQDLSETGFIGDSKANRELTPQERAVFAQWLQRIMPGWRLKVFIGVSLVVGIVWFAGEFTSDSDPPVSSSDEQEVSSENAQQTRLEQKTDSQRPLGGGVVWIGLTGLLTVDQSEFLRKKREELG